MRLNSLALRLFVGAAIWMMVALPVAGYVLTSMFRDQTERDLDVRLSSLLPLLISASIPDEGGALLKPDQPGDELFQFPETGWYWQIKPIGVDGGPLFVSDSLTDKVLDVPFAKALSVPGEQFRFMNMTGPAGRPLRVIAQIFPVTSTDRAQHLYAVTASREEVDKFVTAFATTVAITFALLAAGLAAAVLFQVAFGLRPLKNIQRALAEIRAGRAEELHGEMPVEIEPLQDEINALIRSNRNIVERARTHVGNLAHALKTPLSVITNEARSQKGSLGRKVSEQAAIMRDQVDHYLDRARMVARAGIISDVTDVEPVVAQLARTLMRIHEDRGIEIAVVCPKAIKFKGETQDFQELLGNLLDNACKWADRRVDVRVEAVEALGSAGARTASKPDVRQLCVTVSDDGPGLTQEQRAQAQTRGFRFDESKPGSGLGLSIVRDLVELYSGRFTLKRSQSGGLAAVLILPRAP